MLAALTALATSLAAAALVFYSWRHRIPWAAGAGWLAAFASTFAWTAALGPEIGTTYAIMVFVCLVWVAVMFMMEPPRATTTESAQRPFQALRGPASRDLLRHGVRFLISVPAAGVVAMMLSVGLVLNLPWSMPAKFAVAIFLYPVLWGALSVWLCAQLDLRKPALVSLALFAVSSLLLML